MRFVDAPEVGRIAERAVTTGPASEAARHLADRDAKGGDGLAANARAERWGRDLRRRLATALPSRRLARDAP